MTATTESYLQARILLAGLHQIVIQLNSSTSFSLFIIRNNRLNQMFHTKMGFALKKLPQIHELYSVIYVHCMRKSTLALPL